MRIFAGTAHPELARAICDALGMSLGASHVVRFSNDNIMVQIDENVRAKDVFVIQSSCPPVADHLLELLITIDALTHASAARIKAVISYFPYVHSDKDRPRISIAARLVADLVMSNNSIDGAG
jgi:ribose-phosphate pyrophosphokinase